MRVRLFSIASIWVLAVAQSAAAADSRTAEQVFKNIQVFQGTPADELIPAMDFIRGALGVDCAFCHDTKGRYPAGYEKDEIPAKRTAREMIRMTRQINESSFHGRSIVTCATCHAGHERPQALAPIATAEIIRERREAATTQELPAAAELFAKYEAAIGGEAAISRLTSRHVVAVTTNVTGQTSRVEAFYKASGDLFVQNGTSGQFPVTVGFDGKQAYRASGPTVIPLNGPDADAIRMAGLFYRNLRLKDQYSDARTLRKESIDGKDAYVVRAATKTPRFSDLLWFDAASGLLLRRTTLTRTVLGPSAQTTDFANYRDVSGVKFAMDTIQSSQADAPRKVHYELLEFNTSLDDAKFAIPVPAAK